MTAPPASAAASAASPSSGPSRSPPPKGSAVEVLVVFLRLGVTAFGGPVAHLGYFREAVVRRRGWLSEAAYGDLVALCQVLPGPASSQVGLGIGLARAGWPGLIAAWLAFTLPSAALMVLAAFGLAGVGDGPWQAGLIGGLKAAAVAVVAQAVRGMAEGLWPDRRHAALGLAAALVVVLWPLLPVALPWAQVAVLAAGGAIGVWLLPRGGLGETPPLALPHGRRLGAVLLVLVGLLLVGLPVLAATVPVLPVALADAAYRAGALVFGGGHVVLPLLQAEVVAPGWVGRDAFLAGYGAAQTLPGPLFAFSAYLGAVAGLPAGPGPALLLAAVALVMVFLPGGLLLAGCLPFWDALRRRPVARAGLAGVNAAVVGLLLAALYDPVFTSAVHGPADFALVLLAALLLMVWKLPPWAGVPLTGAAGALLAVILAA
jgi:chromate transporter